jgi:hypothetical protein
LQHLAAVKKKQYWLGLMQDLEVDFLNDQRLFFSQISKLRGKKNNTKIHSPKNSNIVEEAYITSDSAELKAIMFDFHSKLGVNDPDDSNFDRLFYHRIVERLNEIDPPEIGPNFCGTSVTLEEVSDILSNLQNHKAQGLDLILNESLKYGGTLLCQSLTDLFNSLWSSEITPSIWAKASVHLIHKGNGADTLAAESYRPISLTSNVMKIFERIILNRCTMQTDASNIFPEEQVGGKSAFARAAHAQIRYIFYEKS